MSTLGFIQAIYDLGALDVGEGLDAYLKFPLEKGGRVIRVFLDLEDNNSDVLQVRGIKKVDLAELKSGVEMKRKYMYRDRVGSNVFWGFTPLYKLGKPKGSSDKNRVDWLGSGGDWAAEKDCHLFKIKHRVLQDYENTGVLSPGSVDVIMAELEKWMDFILENLQSKESHIVVFGAERAGDFVYPGEMPAFVRYFKTKLDQSLAGNKDKKTEKNCAICRQSASGLVTLDTVFKFATMDKVNFLPGLDGKEKDHNFSLCPECLRKVSAGRERVERMLTVTDVIPGLRMWIIPEAVGAVSGTALRTVVERLEQTLDENKLKALDEGQEKRMFSSLVREGSGLVFHFLFWERNNAQELVHLMVEDVPPERLAFLEKTWKQVMRAVMGAEVEKGLYLDWAMKSIYFVLSRFAGKSDADKTVFRDFALKVIGKMLKREMLPLATFKKMLISRATRLVYENEHWDEVKRSLLYAQVWVEYMTYINREVSL